MTKIAYNACFGSFSLSADAIRLARTLSNDPTWGDCILKGETYEEDGVEIAEYADMGYIDDIKRTDPILITVIETLGEAASGSHSRLLIREVPPGTRYRIEGYDGNETVRLESEYTWETA